MSISQHPSPPSAPEAKRMPMVGWYDPVQLMHTASKVAVSTLFGRNADFRLIEALAAPDHCETVISPDADGGVWLDYVADLGDGWNSTYAIAQAIATDELALRDPAGTTHPTRRGSVLVFGGDAVYPVASRGEYKRRVVVPYEAACNESDPAAAPLVRAVPGNHDWYDSLVAFTRLFCSRDWFAGWRARQACSYFALKLPQGWWVLGTDIQLDSDIDAPQVRFFRGIAAKMQPGDRVILCNAEPHWIYAQVYGDSNPDINENNLAFLERKVLEGRRIDVFLAGDLHHYRRHEDAEGRQKITAGGGGAFLHPTHGADVSKLDGGYELKQSFPDTKTSRRLTWRNLGFLLRNPWFGAVSGVLYMLTAWTAKTDLSARPIGDIGGALAQAAQAALDQPAGAFWAVAVLLGFWLFTDTHSRAYRLVAGTLHGLAHLAAVFFIGWFVTWLTVRVFGLAFATIPQLLLAGALMIALGWIAGSVIMGAYLLLSLNAFGRHANEAFSSLRIEDWKNFLRLHVDASGTLTIYPVGIRRVARRWRAREGAARGPRFVPDDPRATPPELIEAPIVIRGERGDGARCDERAAEIVAHA